MLANELKKSLLASLWFMFLTFPIMVIRVNTVENIIEWRWANLFYHGDRQLSYCLRCGAT